MLLGFQYTGLDLQCTEISKIIFFTNTVTSCRTGVPILRSKDCYQRAVEAVGGGTGSDQGCHMSHFPKNINIYVF